MRRPERLLHRTFLGGVALKGVDGLLEILGGGALLLGSRVEILHAVHVLTRGELMEDPRDFVANLLLRTVRHLGAGTKEFAGLYLLVHGVIKACLVVGLMEGAAWSFPAALIFLAGFVGYQLYRLAHTRSLVLAALTVLDLAILALIWLEWRRLRACSPPQNPGRPGQ